MAWWDDAYDAVVGAVDTVAEVVETVANVVADTAADAAETAGNAAQDGLNAAGNALGGGVVGGVLAWVGGVAAGAGNIVGAVFKGAVGLVGAGVAGLIRVVGGVVLLNGDLIVKGLIGIGSGIAGAILAVLFTVGVQLQRVVLAQDHARPLTKDERAMLRVVFMNSLSLYNIRVIDGRSGVPGAFSDAPFTLNNTIYANGTDFAASRAVLVHECVHAWQYQNLGTRYLMDALGAQGIYGRDGSEGDAYDWEAELQRGRVRWEDFNKESQAALIQDIWATGTLTRGGPPSTGAGAFFEFDDCAASLGPAFCEAAFVVDDVTHTDLATAAVASLRRRFNFRLSRSL